MGRCDGRLDIYRHVLHLFLANHHISPRDFNVRCDFSSSKSVMDICLHPILGEVPDMHPTIMCRGANQDCIEGANL
jgi:hypothetical protein